MMHAAPASALSLELLQRFVQNYPDKTVDILMRYCQDQRIQNEIFTHFATQPGHGQFEPQSPHKGLSITLNPAHSASPRSSHYTGSPPPARHRQPSRTLSAPRPMKPPSPPTTASSVTSHSSTEEAASGEYIVLVTLSDRVEENLVRKRNALIEHSVISDDVISARKLDGNLSPINVSLVCLPNSRAVQASYLAQLTWRRPKSDKTHSTAFYVVPKEMLDDVDILLGYKDSGERPPTISYPPTIAPQPQRTQSYMVNQHEHTVVPPPVLTPPAASVSYHRSAMMYDDSVSATPLHPQQQVMENLMARQHGFSATVADPFQSPHSSAATVLGSRAARVEHSLPHRPSAAPTQTIPSHTIDRNIPTSDRLRVALVWEKTQMNTWLDLRASGEDFFDIFTRLADRHQRQFERSSVTISLKKDKHTTMNEAYLLRLDEEELEMDWETTVSWLEENRRERPPHIYGDIVIEDG